MQPNSKKFSLLLETKMVQYNIYMKNYHHMVFSILGIHIRLYFIFLL